MLSVAAGARSGMLVVACEGVMRVSRATPWSKQGTSWVPTAADAGPLSVGVGCPVVVCRMRTGTGTGTVGGVCPGDPTAAPATAVGLGEGVVVCMVNACACQRKRCLAVNLNALTKLSG